VLFLSIRRKSIGVKIEKIKHCNVKLKPPPEYIKIAKDFDASYNNYISKTKDYKGWICSFFPTTPEFKARKVCAERTETLNNFINKLLK
jgi:hypothetical protein